MRNFRQVDRTTGFLLPPSVDEWLPEGHLARFIVEVIEHLDLTAEHIDKKFANNRAENSHQPVRRRERLAKLPAIKGLGMPVPRQWSGRNYPIMVICAADDYAHRLGRARASPRRRVGVRGGEAVLEGVPRAFHGAEGHRGRPRHGALSRPPAERRTPPRPDLLAHSHPEAFITGHLNQQSNDGERGPTFLDGIKPVC